MSAFNQITGDGQGRARPGTGQGGGRGRNGMRRSPFLSAMTLATADQRFNDSTLLPRRSEAKTGQR